MISKKLCCAINVRYGQRVCHKGKEGNHMEENRAKVYVQVMAEFMPDGRVRPKSITWTDGRRFDIDRITDCRRAASLKAGGCGMRYTCMICGRRSFLYLEDGNRWFMEAV